MMYCPKCGSIMRADASKGGALACSNCGFVSGLKAGKVTEAGTHPSESKMGVAEDNKEIYPKVQAECPKCGNNEAVFWTKQTRAADEAETRFYRCTKCKHTWREYR